MPDVLLRGCTPEPLASYLKALGILRLVAEQADPDARGAWSPEGFELTSTLDEDALIGFFVNAYQPTPVIAPWNGGSGFFPNDNRTAIAAIAGSTDSRFAAFRAAIGTAREVLRRLKVEEKPEKEFKEKTLLHSMRAELTDAALDWLDAVVVLTSSGPKYPPLLGTGGNDGRLDFTNNQMQRLVELLLCEPKARDLSQRRLSACLFAGAEPGLKSSAIGQFHPAAAGGANAGPGFSREALVNPWDYALMIEGALMFASAATKRFESSNASGMVFPFMVSATGVGYASASAADEQGSRNELWLPIWSTPASLRELRVLFSEGRAKVGGRDARSGVDFARAVASLGVDRGINSFTRFGFHSRNGLAYMATPLGRMQVKRNKQVDLIARLDRWLGDMRRNGMGERTPASVRSGARALEGAIVDLCSGVSERPTEVLLRLGELERVLSRCREPELTPVPALSGDWLAACDDGSVEFALARSLASAGLRERLVRVRWKTPWQWEKLDDGRTVWGDGSLVDNLIAVIERREVERSRSDNEQSRRFERVHPVDLEGLVEFIDGHTDDRKIEALLRGLAIVDFAHADPGTERAASASPNAAFALLALALAREPIPGVSLPRTPGMVARIATGDAASATALAARRLRGARLVPRARLVREPTTRARRIAAALAFPLGSRAMARIAQRTLIHQPARQTQEQE